MDNKKRSSIKPEEVNWIAEARIKIQKVLHRLYQLECDPRYVTQSQFQPGKGFGRLTGAAFSLWRAAPLLWVDDDEDGEVRDRKKTLEYLVRDNAINYPQDRENREWMGGYYLNNAIVRLGSLSKDYANELSVPFESWDIAEQEVWDITLSLLERLVDDISKG